MCLRDDITQFGDQMVIPITLHLSLYCHVLSPLSFFLVLLQLAGQAIMNHG